MPGRRKERLHRGIEDQTACTGIPPDGGWEVVTEEGWEPPEGLPVSEVVSAEEMAGRVALLGPGRSAGALELTPLYIRRSWAEEVADTGGSKR